MEEVYIISGAKEMLLDYFTFMRHSLAEIRQSRGNRNLSELPDIEDVIEWQTEIFISRALKGLNLNTEKDVI